MSGAAVEKAAAVAAPIAAADVTAVTGVHRMTITGSSQNVAIPAALQGRYVTLYCTVVCQYAFKRGSAATLVVDQTAAIGTGNAAAGKSLPALQDKDVPVPKATVPGEAVYLSWIGTSGFLEVVCSETPAV